LGIVLLPKNWEVYCLFFNLLKENVMIREATLIRIADRLTAYIQNYVTLAGAEKREEVLDLFDKMHLLFPHWVIMTCPVMHPDIRYVSKNYPYLFGDNNGHIINGDSIAQYFEQVHDADRQDLHSCYDFIHNLIESVPAALHYQYRSIYHYRFKKQNNQYMYLHDEKAVLHLKGSGNLYFALCKDITEEKSFGGVKTEVFKQEHTLKKIAEYKPAAERNPLSKREGELVTLIKQGLSTKEIAWYLKISHNTVRNIKSKMFEKYNVNNTIELLNMTA
jgi:DNA-binding CsgD family transcriptional regulator